MPPAGLYADQPDAGPILSPPTAETGILEGPLRPAILRLALPAVGTTLFQVLFNITDTFWVGRTLGPEALAAVSLASYSVWILVAIGELVGVGLTAVAARRHGERDPLGAARAAGTALVMAVVLGVAVGAAGIVSLPAIFGLMRTTGRVAELARDFLVVQLLGAVLIYGYFVITAAFRSAGDTRTPFLLLGGSVLLNLVLDPVMILGWGPVPALGVYGAALATVLTRGLGFVVGLELLRRRGGLRLDLSLPVARTIARIGLPTMLTGVLFSAIYMVLVRVVGRFGTPAIAALGVGHKIEGAGYMVCIGFGLAAETLVGQNLGAGQPGRAREAGWLTVRLASVPAVLLALVFMAAPASLAGIFTSDPAVVHDASRYLRAAGVAQLVMAFETVLEGALTGAGYTFYTMLVVVGISAIRVPLAGLVAASFGLAGIWWMLALTAMARAAAMTSLWRWGRWEAARA
ncbi:MAG TPA: MATE family efflux transporter [Gemmatimonadales bacterium]|nr:MATE family efflux transporter [Gemmatimonadales bacterium]